MSQTAVRIIFACGIALGAADMAHAQAGQANPNAAQKKQKKQPNQVPDTGVDSPAPDLDGPFERVVTNVPVTVRADGTIVADLDESFMEAVTVTVAADGTLQFGHHAGLANAIRAVRLLPARQLPQVFPILEEKE